MPIAKKIIEFLDKNKIKYEKISHRKVFTAYDKAATLRVKPSMIGKTLILKINGDLVITLIPGNRNLDKNKFKKLAKTKRVDFISEKLMKNKFKGVKIGAIPPFGNLWKLQTFIDRNLTNQPKIIVSGGDYNWSIKINPAVLKKTTPDLVAGSFSKPRK
jgi:Ala-tRNA(Pro) deacylase